MKNTTLISKAILGWNPCEPDEFAKENFHKAGKKFLKELGNFLNLGNFEVKSNKGGIAVSGEVTLYSDILMIQVSADTSCFGNIMFRAVNGKKDYTGKGNNWCDIQNAQMKISCFLSTLK